MADDINSLIEAALNAEPPEGEGEGAPKEGAAAAGAGDQSKENGADGANGSPDKVKDEYTQKLETLVGWETELKTAKEALEAEKATTAAEKDKVARFLKAAEALEKGDDEAAAEALWGSRFTIDDVLTKLANAERFKAGAKPVNIEEAIEKKIAEREAKKEADAKAAREAAATAAKAALDEQTKSYLGTVQTWLDEHKAEYPLFFAWDEDDGVDHEAEFRKIIDKALNGPEGKCPSPKDLADALEGRYKKIVARTGVVPAPAEGEDFDKEIESMRARAAESRATGKLQEALSPHQKALKLLEEGEREDDERRRLKPRASA